MKSHKLTGRSSDMNMHAVNVCQFCVFFPCYELSLDSLKLLDNFRLLLYLNLEIFGIMMQI